MLDVWTCVLAYVPGLLVCFGICLLNCYVHVGYLWVLISGTSPLPPLTNSVVLGLWSNCHLLGHVWYFGIRWVELIWDWYCTVMVMLGLFSVASLFACVISCLMPVLVAWFLVPPLLLVQPCACMSLGWLGVFLVVACWFLIMAEVGFPFYFWAVLVVV
jgi:hypothetical protein